jgi:hypothetical protein
MTRSSCSACRLRFSRAGSTLASCPFCAGPLQSAPASALVGYQLIAFDALGLDETGSAAECARANSAAPTDR